MNDLERELIYLIVGLLALIGSGAGFTVWVVRYYAKINAKSDAERAKMFGELSSGWLQTQEALSANLNRQIEKATAAEDGRLVEKEQRIEINLKLAESAVRIATLETEVARVTRINGDMDLTVKEIATKLAFADDERKATAAENKELKATIARLEAKIIMFEQMELELKNLRSEFNKEVQRSTRLQAQLNVKQTEIDQLKTRLDAFEDQKALEERPVSKPPSDPMIIEGQFKAETPEDGSAA